MEEKLKIFADVIRTAQSVAIFGHKNPDGDSLCSVLALGRLIEMNFGIRPFCIYDGNIPDNMDAMPLRPHIRFYERLNSLKFDVAIVLDCGSLTQIGGCARVVEQAGQLISIDHHRKDAPLAPLDFDDANAAATGEIIYEMMRAGNWEFDRDVVNLLATAIITDTGYFKFARRGEPLHAMADLVDAGADLQYITDMLAAKPKRAVLTEAAVASRAQFFYKDRLAVAVIGRDDYKNLDGKGEITMNLLRQIKRVEYIVLLKQQAENRIGVSLRSRTHPVNHIAEQLGGGGHLYASGAVIHGETLENVFNRIIEMFRGEMA